MLNNKKIIYLLYLFCSLSILTANSCPEGQVCCDPFTDCAECCPDNSDWKSKSINNNIKFSRNIMNKLSKENPLLNKQSFYINKYFSIDLQFSIN